MCVCMCANKFPLYTKTPAYWCLFTWSFSTRSMASCFLCTTPLCGFTANMFSINLRWTGWVLSCSKMYSGEPQITPDYPQPPKPNQLDNLLSNLVMFSVSGDLS